jgi:3-oxoacyl-[acyl-carrier protein] reductase
MRLQNKVALVTGGAEGLGRAYSLAYAREGARLVIADINEQAAQNTAREISSMGGQAIAIRTDVSQAVAVQDMVNKALQHFGRIDILLNNAGKYVRNPALRANVWEMDLEEWEKVIAVNLTGVFLCCKSVIPHMIAQKSGKIINVASSLAFLGTRQFAHYVASKGGIVSFTRAICREVGEYNIQVNTLCPGYTLSSDPLTLSESARKVEISSRAISRAEYPEDVVGAAIFLASSESDFMTGQALVVDGGNVMH